MTEGADLFRGEPGEQRSIGLAILLTIVTLGIYQFYWVYKTHAELKRYTGHGVGGLGGVLIFIIVGVVTPFLLGAETKQLIGRSSPVSGWTGLWILLPLVGAIVWFAKVQGALNRYWAAHAQ